ncbi:MAG: hypothetical protein RLP02_30310, partial [Coleofasciculus sp. C2-GNP5-27]
EDIWHNLTHNSLKVMASLLIRRCAVFAVNVYTWKQDRIKNDARSQLQQVEVLVSLPLTLYSLAHPT